MSDEKSTQSPWALPLIILSLGFVAWLFLKADKTSFSFGDAKIEAEQNSEEENKGIQRQLDYHVAGDYEMVFDFKRCQNPDLAMSQIKTYSEIRLNQDNLKVKGTGHKMAEANNGKRTNYTKKFPLLFEGEILGDTLILNIFENNSNQEVSGIVKFPLKNSRSRFTGIFYASGENCDGDITLTRQDKK